MKTATDKSKVVVIGIDGATFSFIQPLIQQGRLPNLARLAQEGAFGILNSTTPPVSPTAWSSFITGCNPGYHGIYDFFDIAPGSYQLRILNASMRQGAAFWDYLNRAGLQTVIMNVPFTFPPQPVRGVMVSGMDTPKGHGQFTHPVEVKTRMEAAIGEPYSVDTFISDIPGYQETPEPELMATFRNNVYRQVENRLAATRYLMNHEAWDFFMTVFTATDRVQHHFWKYLDQENSPFSNVIPSVYERIDACVGEILAHCDERTTVVLMSDHGAGPLKRACLLNNWLESQGYLVRNKKGSGITRNVLSGGLKLLRQLLPQGLKQAVKSRLPELKGRIASTMILADIDWEKTVAFSEGFFGNIFINQKGRRPLGIVEDAQVEALCQEIAKKALEITDPESGCRIVTEAKLRQQVYRGPALQSAPDLILSAEVGYQLVGDYLKSQHVSGENPKGIVVEVSDTRVSGTHRPEGIFMISGPGILPGRELPPLEMEDLAPTILALLGVAVPDHMDGKVVKGCFKEELRIQTVQGEPGAGSSSENQGYTEQEEADVKERLKTLGYL